MNYDLLVHVDLPEESRFVMALGNINNYLAALNGEACKVVLLANGGAARFLAQKDNAQTEAIEKLAQAGVSFRVCANAMKKVPITKEDLLPCAEVVPAEPRAPFFALPRRFMETLPPEGKPVLTPTAASRHPSPWDSPQRRKDARPCGGSNGLPGSAASTAFPNTAKKEKR